MCAFYILTAERPLSQKTKPFQVQRSLPPSSIPQLKLQASPYFRFGLRGVQPALWKLQFTGRRGRTATQSPGPAPCPPPASTHGMLERCSVAEGGNMFWKFLEPGFLKRCRGELP